MRGGQCDAQLRAVQVPRLLIMQAASAAACIATASTFATAAPGTATTRLTASCVSCTFVSAAVRTAIAAGGLLFSDRSGPHV